jgi:hypothetical protein
MKGCTSKRASLSQSHIYAMNETTQRRDYRAIDEERERADDTNGHTRTHAADTIGRTRR